MTDQPHVYSTSDPDTVAAYLANREAQRAFARQVCADAAAIGKHRGPLRTGGLLGGFEVPGLAAEDPNDPPEGWQYSKGRGHLIPRRGKTGDGARAWLAVHQPPEDYLTLLSRHGLPRNDGLDGGATGRIGVPDVFEVDGTLWAMYRGVPTNWPSDGDECTWDRRKLSEFHAAKEAHDEAAREQVAA